MATNEEIEFAQQALQSVRHGPAHTKMPDGYWVPWHIADLLLAGLKDEAHDEEGTGVVGVHAGCRYRISSKVFAHVVEQHAR